MKRGVRCKLARHVSDISTKAHGGEPFEALGDRRWYDEDASQLMADREEMSEMLKRRLLQTSQEEDAGEMGICERRHPRKSDMRNCSSIRRSISVTNSGTGSG